MPTFPSSVVPEMNDAELVIARQRRSARIPARLRAGIRKIVMWLALLLIGVLAIPALLLIFMIGVLWELADTAIRIIDP